MYIFNKLQVILNLNFIWHLKSYMYEWDFPLGNLSNNSQVIQQNYTQTKAMYIYTQRQKHMI